MKYVIPCCILAVFFTASFISCAPSNSVGSSTALNSAPSSLVLTRTDSSKNSTLGLNCGCPFPAASNQPLTINGFGDTSVVTFQFAESLTKDTTLHTAIATIHPSKLAGSGTASTWIAFQYVDNNYGSLHNLYDTLRVTANY